MGARNPTINAAIQQANATQRPSTIRAVDPLAVAAGLGGQQVLPASAYVQPSPPPAAVAQTAAPQVAGILSGGLTNATMAAQEMAPPMDPTAGMTPEQLAEYQRVQALNARFGTDLSWLDPAFQYQPTLLGQSAGSQAAADPNAIAAQQAAMQVGGQYATNNLQFQSPDQQNALMQQWAQIQGGAGAPTFMGNGTQQQLMQQLLGVAAPQFMSDANQQGLLNSATAFMNNTGPGALTFDDGSRQREQYGNLQEIIAGGGANAIEMAQRAAARADSEAWLRGQREADMADYAERGLTGSGMELMNLAADRQSAAQRNSLADLQTSAALEQRRMDAINSASGLATNMRGQTIDEQSLLNNRAMTGLNAATSLANTMRSQTMQEQLGLNQALQSQAMGAAQIAGQMRGQDYNELTYNDQRGINALTQQTNLSNTMRDQQANEQISNRNAQLQALGIVGNLANSARSQSAQESQYRASAADDFAVLNQSAINNAATANTNFLQNAYQSMMNNRQQWEQTMAALGVDVAGGLMDFDYRENANASNQANAIGSQVAGQFNQAQANYNGAMTGMGTSNNAMNAAAQNMYNQIYPQMGQVMGGAADAIVSAGIGAAGQGAAGQAGQSGAAGAGVNVAAGQATGNNGFDWNRWAQGVFN